MNTPESTVEWQAVVDVAQLLLSLDLARDFGLIKSGLKIDAERCRELLDQGADEGVQPRDVSSPAMLLSSVLRICDQDGLASIGRMTPPNELTVQLRMERIRAPDMFKSNVVANFDIVNEDRRRVGRVSIHRSGFLVEAGEGTYSLNPSVLYNAVAAAYGAELTESA